MDKELEDYYSARFEMFSSKGWKDLMEDVESMKTGTNRLDGINSDAELHFRRGELSIIRWILGLEGMTNDAFTDLSES